MSISTDGRHEKDISMFTFCSQVYSAYRAKVFYCAGGALTGG